MKCVRNRREIGEEYPDYLRDESRLTAPHVDALAWPETEEDVCTALREAACEEWDVTVSGARTGIVGGAVPLRGGMVLSLEKMSGIHDIYEENGSCYMRVGAGTTLQNIAHALGEPSQEGAGACSLSSSAQKSIGDLRREGISLFYAPDPTEMTASIGGTCATNASGARSFRYGATRAHVAGLRVLLSDGTPVTLKRGAQCAQAGFLRVPLEPSGKFLELPVPSYSLPKTKHCAGYYTAPDLDAIDVFIGSEGTLGIVTECTLRLTVQSGMRTALLSFFSDDADAFAYVGLVKEAACAEELCVDAIEYFDAHALALARELSPEEFPVPSSAVAAVYTELVVDEEAWEDDFSRIETFLQRTHSSADTSWAATEGKELLRIKAFRHAVPEAINTRIAARKRDIPSLHKIATDLAVPDDALMAMLTTYRTACEKADVPYVIFGHIGENHLHVNMLPENEEALARAREVYHTCASCAVSYGGTVAAEHGIGKLKRAFLPMQFGEEGVAQMQRIKAVCDPDGRLGHGTLFFTQDEINGR